MGVLAHKPQPPIRGVYGVILKRLIDIDNGRVIPFPHVFLRLGQCFSLTKPECWETLHILSDFGYIKIVAFHGIRMLKS